MTTDVAIVATHIPPTKGYGGIAESTGRLAAGWLVRGRRFRLCASDASTDRPLTVSDVGLPGSVPVALYHAHWFPRFAFGLGAPAAILATCRGARAVYISGISTWPTSVAGLLCRLMGQPFVVAPRGGLMAPHVAKIRRHKPHKWLFYKLVTLPTVRAAAGVHATSAIEADDVRLLFPDAVIEVAPNGLDLAEWPVQPPPPAAPGRVFCYVGRLSAEKGIKRFLELWLEARGPLDRMLVVGTGHGTAYERTVLDLARGSGGVVELLGYQDQAGVQRVLRASDVLVLPSGLEDGADRENFGNSVAEALAAGRPVLVTRGLAWDVVEERGMGLVFEREAGSVRAAVRRVGAMTPDELAAMGRAARAYAEEVLDLRVTSERVWRFIAERAGTAARPRLSRPVP
jgi:glycosyltransferase involved in cell wall biosynthesis